MEKYRKKPVVIDAKQWFFDGDHSKVHRWKPNDESQLCPKCENSMLCHGRIEMLEGFHIVSPGDWIIKGVEGEFYPCKPDIFQKTYDKV